MKAKLSVLFESLKGKANNVVAKGSSRGQIMMVRSIGKDPRTEPQIKARQRFVNMARLWKSLSNEQRAEWNMPGDGFVSAYARFSYQNTNLHSIGINPIITMNNTHLTSYKATLSIVIDWTEKLFTLQVINGGTGGKCSILVTMAKPTKEILSLDTYKPVIIGSVVDDGKVSRNFFRVIEQQRWELPFVPMAARMQTFVVSRLSGFKYVAADAVEDIMPKVNFREYIEKITPVLP